LLAFPWDDVYDRVMLVWHYFYPEEPYPYSQLMHIYNHLEKNVQCGCVHRSVKDFDIDREFDLEESLQSALLNMYSGKPFLSKPNELAPHVSKLVDQILNPDECTSGIVLPPSINCKGMVSVRNHLRQNCVWAMTQDSLGNPITTGTAGELMVIASPNIRYGILMTHGSTYSPGAGEVIHFQTRYVTNGSPSIKGNMISSSPLTTLGTDSRAHFVFPNAWQTIDFVGTIYQDASYYTIDMIPAAGGALSINWQASLIRTTDSTALDSSGFIQLIRNKATKAWSGVASSVGGACPSTVVTSNGVINGGLNQSYDAIAFIYVSDQLSDCEWEMNIQVGYTTSGTTTIPNVSRHLSQVKFGIELNGAFMDFAMIGGSCWFQNTSSELYNGGNTGACYTQLGYGPGDFSTSNLTQAMSIIPGAIEGKQKDGLYGYLTPSLHDCTPKPFTSYRFDNSLVFCSNVPDRNNSSAQIMCSYIWGLTSYDQNYHYDYPVSFSGWELVLDVIRKTAKIMENAQHLNIIKKSLNEVKKLINSKELSQAIGGVAQTINNVAKASPISPLGGAVQTVSGVTAKAAKSNAKRIDKKSSPPKRPPPKPPQKK